MFIMEIAFPETPEVHLKFLKQLHGGLSILRDHGTRMMKSLKQHLLLQIVPVS